jgi:hypothetical protein
VGVFGTMDAFIRLEIVLKNQGDYTLVLNTMTMFNVNDLVMKLPFDKTLFTVEIRPFKELEVSEIAECLKNSIFINSF